ncbi:hypothetical protein IAD21_00296 [Abditibacteriota bacterium]|nr:hypothetical protein IAD21_00296 [Abditibacteriota bacterium]
MLAALGPDGRQIMFYDTPFTGTVAANSDGSNLRELFAEFAQDGA